ncbi:hypothetical protein [Kitasatospora phosalacinea]|uniref:hypothetical protein n=1 Tax=Kitasatospora phosalacinea TaxID=2065 RepID=UPI0025543979|nr:hypothetical protein [Kitasatospora phosalacinea]
MEELLAADNGGGLVDDDALAALAQRAAQRVAQPEAVQQAVPAARRSRPAPQDGDGAPPPHFPRAEKIGRRQDSPGYDPVVNSDAHEKDDQGGGQADQKLCEVCGTPLPRRQGRGRPARYCTDSASCRSKASRARQRTARLTDGQLLDALKAVAPMRPGAADAMPPGPLQRVAALGEALGGAAYHYAATVQADGASAQALERLRQVVALFSGQLLEAAEQAHRDALANPPIPLRAENGSAPRLVAARPGGPGGASRWGSGLDGAPISARNENRAPANESPILQRAENESAPRLVAARPGGPGGASRQGAAPAPAVPGFDGAPISARDENRPPVSEPPISQRAEKAADTTPPHAGTRYASDPLDRVPISRRGLGPTEYASVLTEIGPHWAIRGWYDQDHLCLIARGDELVGWVEEEPGSGWLAFVGLESSHTYLVDGQDRPVLLANARLAACALSLALRQDPART